MQYFSREKFVQTLCKPQNKPRQARSVSALEKLSAFRTDKNGVERIAGVVKYATRGCIYD